MTWTHFAALIVILFSFSTSHGDDSGDWGKGCIEEEPQADCCGARQAPVTQAKGASKDILNNPSLRDQYVKDFSWDFLRDQYPQTKCEANVASAFDVTPTAKYRSCPGDSPKGGIAEALCLANPDAMDCGGAPLVSPAAVDAQKKLLREIWPLLHNPTAQTDLTREDAACTAATSQLIKIEDRPTSNNLGHLTYDPTDDLKNVRHQAEVSCGNKANFLGHIWNGQTPEMQSFLSAWSKKIRSNPSINENQFYEQALAVKNNKTQYDKSAYGLTLQKAVWEQECSANKRNAVLEKHMAKDSEGQFTGEPAPGSNYDAELNQALFSDGGTAALAFMSRSDKYNPVSKQLSCHLIQKYFKHPREVQKIKAYVIGGITVVISIATANLESCAIAGVILSSVTTGAALLDAHDKCGEFIGSLQTVDACKISKGHESDARFLASNSDSETQCTGAIRNAAMGSLGIAMASVKLGATAADSLGTSEKAVGFETSEGIAAVEAKTGETLTLEQKLAVQQAHEVGVKPFTPAQIRLKYRIMRNAGINPQTIKVLMEDGVAGREAEQVSMIIPSYKVPRAIPADLHELRPDEILLTKVGQNYEAVTIKNSVSFNDFIVTDSNGSVRPIPKNNLFSQRSLAEAEKQALKQLKSKLTSVLSDSPTVNGPAKIPPHVDPEVYHKLVSLQPGQRAAIVKDEVAKDSSFRDITIRKLYPVEGNKGLDTTRNTINFTHDSHIKNLNWVEDGPKIKSVSSSEGFGKVTFDTSSSNRGSLSDVDKIPTNANIRVRFAGDLSDRNLQFSGLSPDGTKFYTYSNGYNIEHSFNNLKFFEFRGLLYESPK